ncbi:hypothetical protein RHGRI_013364 [Rhododendron griersonianum]|uniref:Uncharacterized protein n=1 Tax=Rhododendron griersonianum TaxID=479676 RepID=A0AAV6K589_9ERIC|nr:hypothetical protein RHGRI_013364 [Rhododendron griersonianum]
MDLINQLVEIEYKGRTTQKQNNKGSTLAVNPAPVLDNNFKDVGKPMAKRKYKSVVEILGIPKTPRNKKGGRRSKQKCVVFHSAIAAAALSISTDGINNRNRILLNESQVVWTVTKIMETDYLGNDEEVINKIMVTDEEEDLRAALLIPPTH